MVLSVFSRYLINQPSITKFELRKLNQLSIVSLISQSRFNCTQSNFHSYSYSHSHSHLHNHIYNSICRNSVFNLNKNNKQFSTTSFNFKERTMSDVISIPNLPKLQYAQVFSVSNGPLEYKQIPVPVPGEDEILINVKYSGVCHTDLHAYKGDWPLATKSPLVGGHEGAGVVVAKGNHVTNFELGDYAGIKWLNGSCLSCEFCKSSYEPNCPEALLSGYTVDGTFQQYAIAKAIHAAPIPKNVELAKVAPILCAGITVYKALKESNAKPGQWVAITGAGGGLGSLAIQYAKAMGLLVLGIDTGDEKSVSAKKLGAEEFVDFAKYNEEGLVEYIQKVTNGGPHAVINVATAEKPIELSTRYVRTKGTVVVVGLPAHAQIKSDVFWSVVKSITIKGSYVGNRTDSDEALNFFARGLIDIPIKIVGLSELPKVYNLMEEGKITGRYVLDTSK